jgi:hypothetical protein
MVTVSGNLKDVGVANITGSNTYVRFTLIGFGDNIPRVVGTNAIIVPSKDFKPDANGNISGSIQGNDTITIGGNSQPGGTQYQVSIYYQGQVFRSATYTITGGAFNLNNAVPNTTSPTIPAPTGDNTYLRLDGGNSGPGYLTTGPGTHSGPETLKNLNGIRFADQFPGADLGAKIMAAVADGGTYIMLSPSASYVQTTQVSITVPGIIIDLNGSTIDISALNAPAFIWSYTYTNTPADFQVPPTGIRNGKFIGGGGAGSLGRVGQVKRLAYFFAENLVIQYAGAFDIQGEAILGWYSNIRNYDPTGTSSPIWKTSLGSGTFGPNASLFDHCYCEQAANSGLTAFELQAGSVIIRDCYFEAISTFIHLNGSGAQGASAVIEGCQFGFRFYNVVGVQIDAMASNGETVINGCSFGFGDSASNTHVGVLNNLSGAHLNMGDNTIEVFCVSTSPSTVVRTTQDLFLKFTGNKYHLFGSSGTQTVFDPNTANGFIDVGTISGNSFFGEAGSTTNFVASGALGSIINQTISANLFLRTTNLVQLGNAVALVGNVFTGPAPTLTFTSGAAGLVAGNVFPVSTTGTLMNSIVRGNVGLTNTENFTATINVTNINATGSGTFPGGLTIGGGGALARYSRYAPTLSPASVAANTTAEQNFASVLTSGDIVVGVSKPTAQAGLGIVGWRASGTTLFITFSNNTASPITPTASEVYQVAAVQ